MWSQILLDSFQGIVKIWSYEIENILRDDKKFIGGYPHDKLPKVKDKFDCSVIIKSNTSPS